MQLNTEHGSDTEQETIYRDGQDKETIARNILQVSCNWFLNTALAAPAIAREASKQSQAIKFL